MACPKIARADGAFHERLGLAAEFGSHKPLPLRPDAAYRKWPRLVRTPLFPREDAGATAGRLLRCSIESPRSRQIGPSPIQSSSAQLRSSSHGCHNNRSMT
jgi:hypothetical protein